ncbi:hypothetical protein [Couchioplanes caeruleus]|uniref:Uncharacterized protein n=2 Tax=Couchioplanes caeruleus TaxID=56438 RepID=A0A1K0FZA6_9ACTN|nr:hypothetical protein [Couchioplanes caeruleus]OJF10402.1 hypothetical protein BG844_32225 [Couchioplanes caeruleus subsp. caeruleus]ROP29790.1 hypothetical protein EDD30_2605 [Couchioplanes caeruleus]
MTDLATTPPSIPVGAGPSKLTTTAPPQPTDPVNLPLIYRNILIGGEPGAGKSNLLNTIVRHAALCADVDTAQSEPLP